MQPRLAVPVAVGSHHQSTAKSVNKGVGRVELYLLGHFFVEVDGIVETLEGVTIMHEEDFILHHHQVGKVVAVRSLTYHHILSCR